MSGTKWAQLLPYLVMIQIRQASCKSSRYGGTLYAGSSTTCSSALHPLHGHHPALCLHPLPTDRHPRHSPALDWTTSQRLPPKSPNQSQQLSRSNTTEDSCPPGPHNGHGPLTEKRPQKCPTSSTTNLPSKLPSIDRERAPHRPKKVQVPHPTASFYLSLASLLRPISVIDPTDTSNPGSSMTIHSFHCVTTRPSTTRRPM